MTPDRAEADLDGRPRTQVDEDDRSERASQLDPDACWFSTRKPTTNGYDRLSVHGERHGAHRLMYELIFGVIPPGLFVCHACDNPACINPRHLWLGTAADNRADCVEKGRHTRGTSHHAAKLNEANVRSIRKAHDQGATERELAEHFGVSLRTIHAVITRKTWKHVEEVAP